ncbi:MAG: HAD-IIIA family hydrolase [Nitrospirae bacterium]|nr:MAG: HAD-IIIA family hydrolase [Nitrospirota bacterium]
MQKTKKQINAIAKNIKLLILDVDGVLTDGSIILDNKGNEIKAFNVRDGHGIKLLQRHGVIVAVITGRESKVVEVRAKELGINEVYQKYHRKAEALEALLRKTGFSAKETACVGDDIVDIPIFRRIALPIAVADAVEEAKSAALLITKNPGGKGAVREVCELILMAKGVWKGIVDEYNKV